jgi:superfamily II DNA or RNA helicase
MKDEFAIHVKNYYFMGKYKAGMWDGKVHFITEASLMPYGLLLDFLQASKKLFPDVPLEVDDGVRNLFKGPDFEPVYDLAYHPRPYQREAIETCLKRTKGIIRSATASGKSLVISYIIKNLLIYRNITGVRKCLIIVPSQSLVEQFKSDMIEYLLPENLIGKVYTGFKEWDKHIVISTWQSLKNNHNKLAQFHCVIGDECHQVKAHELKKIFSKLRCQYRFGFTGTIPNHLTDQYNIKAFLGPVLREYSSGFLAEEGFISKCNVKIFRVPYPDGTMARDYIGIKEECFKNQRRLKLIGDLVKEADDNILLLVSYIHEGETLKNLLNRRTDKEVVFLSGKDKVAVREEWRQKVINSNNIAIIATYGIFQQGINIPNLKYAMLASPNKSKVRTLQSVGRTLRLHENKADGAIIYDIIDDVKFLQKHGEHRIAFYENEGFDIEIKENNYFIKKDEFKV